MEMIMELYMPLQYIPLQERLHIYILVTNGDELQCSTEQ